MQTKSKLKSFFSVEYTNLAKGVAIFMMLFHHLALDPMLNFAASDSLEYKIGLQCKVCVAIFVVLSGYGLMASAARRKAERPLQLVKFITKHLRKLMTNFWAIFILAILFGVISGKRPLAEVYGGGVYD